MKKTIIEKIWDAHCVKSLDGGRDVLYIDRHYIHEVTSPVAFATLRERGIDVFRADLVVATADHNTPTIDQHLPVKNKESRAQLDQFYRNCTEAEIRNFFPLGHPGNGVVHIVGPELGFTEPGMTIVCGDSHTSTHGAFGAVAFGVGTSEVAMVLASQCIIQAQPKAMRITIDGVLPPQTSAKDIALYVIAQIGTAGGAGHFIEFAGSAISALTMEGRMTLCNMSIECGARGAIIAPDEVTFDYLGIESFELQSDEGAIFDKEYHFDASAIRPMITWGTNPAQGIFLDGVIPDDAEAKALRYMGFERGEQLLGHKVDYVFLGSCTNGRIEDFRVFAAQVKGHHKADNVVAWLVPGSGNVLRQIKAEGLDRILLAAGFVLRQPGCSACLAMNDDKIPAGKYSVSTSNRNFEGRQGPGSRTMLASPRTAALAAITGRITQCITE
ncbi:MAG: 3-isopropylmalate dehydratase large subunit [Mucinivorans sp.]